MVRDCTECPDEETGNQNTKPKSNSTEFFPREQARSSKIQEKTFKALKTAVTQSEEADVWYLDSAASDHMTSCQDKLSSLRPKSSIVEVANSDTMKVEGTGDATLNLSDENGGITLTLANVLYVPNLDGNLLSVGRIEEMGCKVVFDNGEARVIDEDGTIILYASRVNRLYKIKEKQQIAKVARRTSSDVL